MEDSNVAAIPEGKAKTAYRRLRDAILKGRIEPGACLSERDLAGQYQISRTPIRQALHQLHKDGCVRLVPRVGAKVSAVSTQDLLDLLEMRRCLEPYAARRAAQRITPTAERELRDVRRVFADDWDGSTVRRVDRLIVADRRLHRLVLKLSGNRRISQALTALTETIQRYRYLGMPLRLDHNTTEHLAIIDALMAGDGAAAELAMAQHLEQFMADVRRASTRSKRWAEATRGIPTQPRPLP